MGKKDSSKTRVRPFFWRLILRDQTGQSWLGKLLQATATGRLTDDWITDPGHIRRFCPEVGSCKEELIGPPVGFLRWLLQHPKELQWQKDGNSRDAQTREWRQKLCLKVPEASTKHLEQMSQEAISEGLMRLEQGGAHGARGEWWSFEGQTHVDFFIETDRGLRIYVEGKRTESLSKGTLWFQKRNQLVRNLEAARENAAGHPFACILMSELPITVAQHLFEDGLPHLGAAERHDVVRGFLGNITWKDACVATGLDFACLPNDC